MNWLKFVPEHEHGGYIYDEEFCTKGSTEKDPRLMKVLVQHGLVAGYLLSLQVVDEASKHMSSCSTREPF